MSRRDDMVGLLHMLEYAREEVDLAKGKERADLEMDRRLGLALTRLMEIVGEAAHRVPEPLKEKYLDIPWQQIIGLRNRLIHAYDAVDLDILWDIVQQDLPPLISELERIVGQS